MSNDDFIANYGTYLNRGLQIAGALVLPIIIGHWLDLYLKTSPWLLFAGCLLGFIAAGIVIYRIWQSVRHNS
jgi:F0F1-type ATP synthase assembly protein I